MFDEIEVDRFVGLVADYRDAVEAADPDTETFRYYPRLASDITYDKTALWLATLERYLGWDTLQSILSTFFERHRFGHPGPEDFFLVANEVAGEDLDWFFDQVHRDSVGFDYAVDSVHSMPVDPTGLVQRGGEIVATEARDEGERVAYRTEAMLRRLGGGVFPVEVLLVFEDGHEIRFDWTGEERSKLFVVDHGSEVRQVVIDPARVLLLDVDYTNNSRLREPRPGLPATKWGSKWMVWFQDLLSTIAFFI
jgi:hypothetical protein